MADYDIILIGGGPGGYTAAIRAAQLGMKVAVVEREHLGGICSNWGCIPTKALLRSAEMLTYMQHAESFGIDLSGEIRPNITAIANRSRKIAERMNGGVGMLLKKNKVDVIWGQAKLTAPDTVVVSEADKPSCKPQAPVPEGVKSHGRYTADHVIIATGARPRVLPGLEPDGDRIWTYFEALKPENTPESLAIVGSGAIGLEFASFYAAMGTDVTVIEVVDRILQAEDAEISQFVQKAFEKRGVNFRTGVKIDQATPKGNSVTLTLSDGDTLSVERVISAAGVVANTECLGLGDLGIVLETGFIPTTGAGATAVRGVYAIGDVAGAPMLAHKAEHEAALCVEAIAGESVSPLSRNRIPACTYCDPQVASVGLTEAQAKDAGRAVKIGKFPFLANGKAIAMGEDQGLAKVIFDAGTGELIGAHLVGPEVTELIQGFATAMELESTEAEIIDTIYPHPTISEVMKEATMVAFGRAVNI